MTCRLHTVCLLLLLCLPAAAAQTLAHPGWRGNGITAEQWWRRTAVVQLPADMTFARATATLDTVAAAGADALLLPDLQPEPGGAAPFADRFGSTDELDMLLREASARRMHVLLTAPLLRLANGSGELRFWLARGIAGFNVGPLRAADVDTLHVLRSAMDRQPGQHLLLTGLDVSADPGFAARFAREFHPPTLALLTAADATRLPVRSMAAVIVTNPAAALAPRGLLPVLPLAALQAEDGAAAARRLLLRSRTVR